MDIPAEYLKKISTPKAHAPRTEWEETLDRFYKKINTTEGVKKYGEFSRARIGRALKGKTQLQIEWLYVSCERAKSFGGLFRYLSSKKN